MTVVEMFALVARSLSIKSDHAHTFLSVKLLIIKIKPTVRMLFSEL